jgi:hypothetical protein
MKITDKLPDLQSLLTSLNIEESLRTIAGNTSGSMTFSMSIDEAGTSYNFSTSEPGGASENYSKRVPYMAPTVETPVETTPPVATPPTGTTTTTPPGKK